MKLFESEVMNESIIRIKMPYVCAYLIKGQDKAALIDTGFGYGHLREFVETLVDTPYDVICTHGHPDHAGGNSQWSSVYLPEGEFELEKYGGKVSTRFNIMNKVLRKEGLNFPLDNFLPYKQVNYIPYNETTIFDLGGITLQPIHLPGHTQGIMGIIIPEIKTAILGDACANPTLLNVNSSSSVEEFRDALLKLTALSDQFDTVLTQHLAYSEPKNVISSNLYLAEQILLGKDDRVKVRMAGTESYVARHRSSYHSKGVSGNIVYLADRIWK